MSTNSYTESRFSANDAALVLIDHQSGIMQLVHDYSLADFRNNVMALAKLGKVFNLPTVLTTSLDGCVGRSVGKFWPVVPQLKEGDVDDESKHRGAPQKARLRDNWSPSLGLICVGKRRETFGEETSYSTES